MMNFGPSLNLDPPSIKNTWISIRGVHFSRELKSYTTTMRFGPPLDMNVRVIFCVVMLVHHIYEWYLLTLILITR